jgi:hypothetical protein
VIPATPIRHPYPARMVPHGWSRPEGPARAGPARLVPAGYASVSSTGVRPGCGVFCEIHASIRAHQS